LKIYLDQTDIRSGQLSLEINQALSDSQALVVCCSEAANASPWVQREIEAFISTGRDKRLGAVLVSGAPEQAMPERLRRLELRFHDLRNGWRVGLLRPKARDELVRLVAFIAGVPLRDLIPWDRRLRRRRALISASAILGFITAVLVYPVLTWQRVDLALEDLTPGPRVIVGCEVADGDLRLLTQYEHCRDGGCVIHTSSDDVRETGATVKVPDAAYSPRSSLVYAGVAPTSLRSRTRAAFPELTDRNIWIGEPAPNSFVAIHPMHPPWRTPDEDSPWPRGQSQVLVYREGHFETADVEGLYAEWDPGLQQPFSGEPPLPSASFSIAWASNEIWIGSPNGLWRTTDAGKTWDEQSEFSGVSSILAASTSAEPPRILVAEMAPIPSRGGPPPPREMKLVERRAGSTEWAPFSGPPFGTQSQLQFCGVPRDGHLVMRVDTWLYRQQHLPVFRLLQHNALERVRDK
jgi:hypothetical protein